MKNLTKIIIVVAAITLLLSSCASTCNCPAYASVDKAQTSKTV